MNTYGGFDVMTAVAIAYAIGVARMWSRVGAGRLVSRVQVVLFALGALVAAVALGPPLDTAADTNLTVHMTQHVLLMMVAAPLIVAGAPLPALLWTLPDAWRIRANQRWRRVHRHVAGDAWPFWVAGAVAFQGIALGTWHLAPPYNAAVRNDGAHVAEHACFFGSSLVVWWVIAGAVSRARFGASVLAIFISKFSGLVIGVGMATSQRSWYSAYGSGPRAVHDQQYAGMVMWVVGGMIATISALVLFALWMQHLERHAPAGESLPHFEEAPA